MREGRLGGRRGLVAVLAADVASYSRLMLADEEGTIARLRTPQRDSTDRAYAKLAERMPEGLRKARMPEE